MWRRNMHDEDWERRKWYLIRSLFDDTPPLSTISEELTTNVVNAPLSSRNLRTDNASTGSTSPLPPLVIEREPCKPNKHDEPEEFYTRLLKRAKKIYRRMFIEDRSDISDIVTESESEYDSDDAITQYNATSFESSAKENLRNEVEDIIITNDNNDINEPGGDITSRKSQSLDDSSTSPENHSKCTPDTDVYDASSSNSENSTNSASNENIEPLYEKITFQAEVHKHASAEIQEISGPVHNKTCLGTDNVDEEDEALNDTSISESSQPSTKVLTELQSCLATSTPKRFEDTSSTNEAVCSIIGTSKRKISSITERHKRKRHADSCVQTEINADHNNEILNNNLFDGTPRVQIFNVCTCNFHVCGE